MEIKYYIIILCSLIFFYTIGKLISSFFISTTNEPNYYYRAFVSLITGLFAVIIVFAIVKTRFNTIMLALIFLFGIWLIKSKFYDFNIKNIKNLLLENFTRDIIILTTVSLILYIFYGALFFEYPFNKIAHGDYYYYTRLIYMMVENGYENTILGLDPFYVGKLEHLHIIIPNCG